MRYFLILLLVISTLNLAVFIVNTNEDLGDNYSLALFGNFFDRILWIFTPKPSPTPTFLAPTATPKTSSSSEPVKKDQVKTTPTPATEITPEVNQSQPTAQIPEETATSTPKIETKLPLINISNIQNLITYWNLDEGSGNTMYDSSPNRITGELININDAKAWLDQGKIGRALELDGMDDFIIISDLPEIDLGKEGQNYSIAFWIKRNGNPGNDNGVISKNDGIGGYPFAVRILKNGRASLEISDGINSTKILSDSAITNNKWRHVVAIRDAYNKQLKLYIDGREVSSSVADTTVGDLRNDDQVWVGKYPFDGSYFYDSFAIDDIRIYGRALFGNEVESLYNFGNGAVSYSSFAKYLFSLIKNLLPY